MTRPIPFGVRMSNAKYHAHPALSRSRLFPMSRSPAYFKHLQDNPPPKTPALTFGSAFHKWVLEPRYFTREFLVIPKVDRRTKEGREIYQAALERAEELRRDVIDSRDMDAIAAMASAVMANRYAARLITSAQIERSFFWVDELTGVRCKCRPDIIATVGGKIYLADLKSCTDASTEAFTKDAVHYGYQLQAAMCMEGFEICTGIRPAGFIFICVEKDAPYFVNLLEADDLFIRYGEEQMRDLLGMYKDCADSGVWYGYGGFTEGINTLSLPPYLQKDYL